jgi:hypothetical protein
MTAYPSWVCSECGLEYGKRQPRVGALSTFHDDTCGICGTFGPCTEPRDFGHLKAGWEQARKFWEAKGGRR